jgi:hypothetical protein
MQVNVPSTINFPFCCTIIIPILHSSSPPYSDKESSGPDEDSYDRDCIVQANLSLIPSEPYRIIQKLYATRNLFFGVSGRPVPVNLWDGNDRCGHFLTFLCCKEEPDMSTICLTFSWFQRTERILDATRIFGSEVYMSLNAVSDGYNFALVYSRSDRSFPFNGFRRILLAKHHATSVWRLTQRDCGQSTRTTIASFSPRPTTFSAQQLPTRRRPASLRCRRTWSRGASRSRSAWSCAPCPQTAW